MEERLIQLLRLALKYGASDIHVAQKYGKTEILMYIDGYMRKIKSKYEDLRLIKYLQYLANLDAFKYGVPQTGQFEIVVDDNLLSLRFAIIDAKEIVNGVLRILKEEKMTTKEKSTDIVEKLETANKYYGSQVKNLFAEIDRLSGNWGGKDNAAFNKRISSHKGDMSELVTVIDEFIEFLKDSDKATPVRGEVPDYADSEILRTVNNNMDETLSGISKIMLDTSSKWKDTPAEEIVTKFQRLANRFIDTSEEIEEYAKFLDWWLRAYSLQGEKRNG